MSKVVTIPTCRDPYVVIVNNKVYSYTAGATIEVPDEVAEVINVHMDAHGAAMAQVSGSGSEGNGLATLVDITLTEAVVSKELRFGKAYRYLEIYCYVPKAAENATNNNAVLLLPNGQSGYSFAIAFISQFGIYAKRQFIECFPEALITYGGGTSSANAVEQHSKNSVEFANGLSWVKLIPSKSGESDMIPVGTHIIIKGR